MTDFVVRTIPIADLRDHPRNSNRHGEHQLAVLEARFRALGWYKNVVVAEWEGETTLLAGHGVTRGAERAGETVAPCHVREIDPLSAEALDILEGDNTVADLAEPDLRDRLRNLVELDEAGRLGNVGYDDGALDRLKAELQAEDFAAGQAPLVERPDATNTATRQVGLWEERDKVVVTIGDFATAFVPRQAARDAGQIVADHFQSEPAEAVATLIEGLANGSVGLC